jgi:hypothetical protein
VAESVVFGGFDVRGVVQRKCGQVWVLVKGATAASRQTLGNNGEKVGDALRLSALGGGPRYQLL